MLIYYGVKRVILMFCRLLYPLVWFPHSNIYWWYTVLCVTGWVVGSLLLAVNHMAGVGIVSECRTCVAATRGPGKIGCLGL